jgi:hypothetical protein
MPATGRHRREGLKLSKKRKLLEEEQGTPATEQDVIDMHVKSLLALDRVSPRVGAEERDRRRIKTTKERVGI